jgi:hypothetical protein
MPYVTDADVNNLGGSINNISNLANALCDNTEYMVSHFST